jgi:hypothetical protein
MDSGSTSCCLQAFDVIGLRMRPVYFFGDRLAAVEGPVHPGMLIVDGFRDGKVTVRVPYSF